MTDITAAPHTSSLNTMLDTIEQGTEILQKVMPEIEAVGGFVPEATPMIQVVALALPAVQNTIKWIMADQGMSPMQAFEDFLKHIAPNNGYVSPALSKAPPTEG